MTTIYPRSFSILFFFFFLLYFPKINLLKFSTTSVGLKPEDIIAPLILFFLSLYYLIKGIKLRRVEINLLCLCIVYIFYISIVSIWYGGSFLYISRYILYFSMLIYAFSMIKNQIGVKIENIAFYTLFIYVLIGFLQKQNLIGGFLVGNYETDVSGRITLLFSNASEVGGITAILYALILGSDRKSFYKILSFIIIMLINYWAENRIAPVTVIVITLIYIVSIIDISKVKFGNVKFMKVKWFIIIIFISLSIFLSIWVLKTLPRFETLDLAENIIASKEYFYSHLDTNIGITKMEDIMVESEGGDKSLLMRIQKWTYAISLILSGYIFGIGAGNNIGDSMDGFYFRLLIESGPIGLLLYFFIFFTILMIIRYKNDFLNGLYLVFLSLLLQGLFLDIFYFSRIGYLFWFLIALKLSSIRGIPVNNNTDGIHLKNYQQS